MDVFGLQWVVDPQISPDGKLIAYVHTSMEIQTDRRRGTLWLVHADGSDALPVTDSDSSISSPRWSPDGTRLAYLSQDGNGLSQLHVYWLQNGAITRITSVTQGSKEFAWSPDSREIAFTMSMPLVRPSLNVDFPQPPSNANWAQPIKLIERAIYRADGRGYVPAAYDQVFVVSATGGEPRQITHGEFAFHGAPAYVPDGKSLLISGNRYPGADIDPLESDIYRIDLADGSTRALTNRHGPDYGPVISPDGKRVAYLGFDNHELFYQVSQLYVMDIDGQNARSLTSSLDRDVKIPQWSADGRRLYFLYEDDADGKIASIDLTGNIHKLTDRVNGADISRPYAGGSFSVAHSGRFAFMQSSPYAPPQLATGTSSANVVTLDLPGRSVLSARNLGKLEPITYQSAVGDLQIHGWLLTPPDFNPQAKYPLILAIHGGPTANYGARFSAEFQLIAAAGYVILYVNPRGSTSYGDHFTNYIHHAFPGDDYSDLMSGVDFVLANRSYIDPTRLFVMGDSGGGVLTAWTVGHTDRFRAAVVGKPAINWMSFVLTSDEANFYYQYWFEGFPWDHPESYWRRSPLAYAGHVRTPTMVMTGEADYRTPSGEAEQFYEALKLRKIDSALVRVPGAPHDISLRPSNLIGKVAYTLAWFREHDAASQ